MLILPEKAFNSRIRFQERSLHFSFLVPKLLGWAHETYSL